MAGYSLTGTSPTMIINTAVKRNYELHADSGNTAIIKVSRDADFSLTTGFEELSPGQGISLRNFTGTFWALVASGTQKLYVVVSDTSEVALKA